MFASEKLLRLRMKESSQAERITLRRNYLQCNKLRIARRSHSSPFLQEDSLDHLNAAYRSVRPLHLEEPAA